MDKRDMYGHLIHVSDTGRGGFGISMTLHGPPGGNADPVRIPEFTFFHESDDFKQALFSVDMTNGRPQVTNIFYDRVSDVLKEFLA